VPAHAATADVDADDASLERAPAAEARDFKATPPRPRDAEKEPEKEPVAAQDDNEGNGNNNMHDIVVSSFGMWEETPPHSGSFGPASDAQEDDDDDEDDDAFRPSEPDLSFVRHARRRAFWRRKPVRIALGALALLLTVTLVLQLLLSQRDWLAAAFPATKGVLSALCAPLGCQIAPYRHLDSVVIEGTSFNRVSPTVYQVNVTMRNRADLPVATPSLELTLTDLQNQTLLRRVIAPQEMGAGPVLEARGDFSGTARLSLSGLPDETDIVGYRALAFYP
jgi:hypothetical protein